MGNSAYRLLLDILKTPDQKRYENYRLALRSEAPPISKLCMHPSHQAAVASYPGRTLDDGHDARIRTKSNRR